MKTNQFGRSMIEMLGVLAIIGVLSVGGIAGYSKAMTKYRINKTADQVSQLAQNIRTLYASQKNYSTLNETVIKKAHLAPEDMYENTNTTTLYNPFGGTFGAYSSGKMYSGDNKAFRIDTSGVPQEACIELLTQDWGNGSASGLIALGDYNAANVYYGSMGTTRGHGAIGGVMSVDKAIAICSSQTDNWLTWKFY